MQFSSDDTTTTWQPGDAGWRPRQLRHLWLPQLTCGLSRLMKVHPLGSISVCTQCHNNTSNSCWDASVWTTAVDGPTLTSQHFRCDFHLSRVPLTDIILRHGKFFNLDVNRSFWDLNHLHVAWKTGTEMFKVVSLPLSSLCQISFLQDVFF